MSKASASYTIARIEDGVGIQSYTYAYMSTQSSTTPSAASEDWTDWETAYAQFGENKRFFWQRETITFTDGTTSVNVWNFNIYNRGENVVIQYCYGSDEEPDDAEFIIGTDAFIIGSTGFVIAQNIWSDSQLTPVAGKYIWMRQGVYNPDSEIFPTDWNYTRLQGDEGTPANVLDFNATGLTYVSNLRVNSYTEIKVTADLQGSYTSGTLYTEKYDGSSWVSANIIYYDTTSHDPMISQSSVSNASEITLRIPMTESAQLRIRMVSSGDTVIKEISPIDETEYDHDWGSVDSLPVSFIDGSGNTCTPLDGDYFVAKVDFEFEAVTPQTGDNPKELGWYIRYGTSEPYTYEKTTDTSVVSGKTYYLPKHFKGVPYTLVNSSWIELTVSNPSDAEKALNLLGSVLNDPSIQPSMKTLYMWVKNLMALEATIESLFSRTITLLNNGVFKSATLTYDSNDNRFVKEGFILDSTGDVKLGKAFLRDIKLKCSDSQSKILLETQEHQDGLSAFNPIDTSVSARWCTNDITGLSYDSPTQVTFNNVSRYMIRPTSSDTGYKHKIITGYRTGGTSGMGIKFVAPYTGRYYIVMGNGDGIYCKCKNITTGQTYFTQAFVGYFSCTAGDTIEAVNASTFDAYFCKYENYVYMVASKTTSTYTESNITRTIEYYQEVDALELGVYPTDTLVIGTSFDSSSHLDYKVISSSFSQLSDGEIKCENNSYLTVDGTTYSDITTIQKTSSILTFNNSSTSVSLSYPRDTSSRAKTGWSKCSGGSIDPVGQDSALITYNIYPSEQNTCYIGNQNNKYASAYINTINSTTVNGTHVGNVNSSGTSYSVYGAVFN